MYSDNKFEIRPQYRERPPRVIRTENYDGDWIVSGIFISVVLTLAVIFVTATWGWLHAFTLVNPQPKQLTERSQHDEHIQEERRGSSARPGGGGFSADPAPGRSTETGEETPPQDQVVPNVREVLVLKEKGAAEAPISYDDFKAMADRDFNHAREFPLSSAVQVWGQDWFPGNIAVKWNAELS